MLNFQQQQQIYHQPSSSNTKTNVTGFYTAGSSSTPGYNVSGSYAAYNGNTYRNVGSTSTQAPHQSITPQSLYQSQVQFQSQAQGTSIPTPAPPTFRAPAHKNSHHLHSIPPREKSTRTLIVDHMLWVHGRTRLAQARAELGMTDRTGGPSTTNYAHRTRPENFEEDEEVESDGEDVNVLLDSPSPPEIKTQDLALARTLRLRAEGLEKVVTSMLGQPPPSPFPHPVPTHGHSFHPHPNSASAASHPSSSTTSSVHHPPSTSAPSHDHQPQSGDQSGEEHRSNTSRTRTGRHPHILPNGVRLRLALGTIVNDFFAREDPSASALGASGAQAKGKGVAEGVQPLMRISGAARFLSMAEDEEEESEDETGEEPDLTYPPEPPQSMASIYDDSTYGFGSSSGFAPSSFYQGHQQIQRENKPVGLSPFAAPGFHDYQNYSTTSGTTSLARGSLAAPANISSSSATRPQRKRRRKIPKPSTRVLELYGAGVGESLDEVGRRCARHLTVACGVCVDAAPGSRSGFNPKSKSSSSKSKSGFGSINVGVSVGAGVGMVGAMNSARATADAGGITGWKDGVGVGAGLRGLEPGESVLRRGGSSSSAASPTKLSKDEDKKAKDGSIKRKPREGSTKLVKLIPRFIKLSALVAGELGREVRGEEVEAPPATSAIPGSGTLTPNPGLPSSGDGVGDSLGEGLGADEESEAESESGSSSSGSSSSASSDRRSSSRGEGKGGSLTPTPSKAKGKEREWTPKGDARIVHAGAATTGSSYPPASSIPQVQPPSSLKPPSQPTSHSHLQHDQSHSHSHHSHHHHHHHHHHLHHHRHGKRAHQKMYHNALQPTREWYLLLAGLLTRAVLEGYLSGGWKGIEGVLAVLGVGVSCERRRGRLVSASGVSSRSASKGPADVKQEEKDSFHLGRDEEDEDDALFEEVEPDEYPTLREAVKVLFPSLRGRSKEREHGSGATSGVQTPLFEERHHEADPLKGKENLKGDAEKEYEDEMKERLALFLDIPSTTTSLSAHLEELAKRFPAEPVERAAIRFCEAIAKWRGKPELEMYNKKKPDSFTSSAGQGSFTIGHTSSSSIGMGMGMSFGSAMAGMGMMSPGGSGMESFVHSNPTSPVVASKAKEKGKRKTGIGAYFSAGPVDDSQSGSGGGLLGKREREEDLASALGGVGKKARV